MTQPSPSPDQETQKAEKARMLITILGTDFTRKSQHPFFRSLTESAANPAAKADGQPDISRALKNLMSHLSTQTKAAPAIAPSPIKSKPSPSENSVSPDQHPALIASSLAKLNGAERRVILRNLGGPIACRVLVYLREIEEKSA